MEKIIKQDLENIALGSEAVREGIGVELERSKSGKRSHLSAVASVMQDATKRHQLFTGGATENVKQVNIYLPDKKVED